VEAKDPFLDSKLTTETSKLADETSKLADETPKLADETPKQKLFVDHAERKDASLDSKIADEKRDLLEKPTNEAEAWKGTRVVSLSGVLFCILSWCFLVLSCLALSLSCLVLSCLVLSCLVLHIVLVLHMSLSCTVLNFFPCLVSCHGVLSASMRHPLPNALTLISVHRERVERSHDFGRVAGHRKSLLRGSQR
jgi:hypothetical protein